MHEFPALIWKSFRRWQQDEASLLAAAVSYYLALSLFPVLLILTSALGVFFKWTNTGNDARSYLLQVISDQMAPALSTAIEQSLAHIEDLSPLSGPIGLLFLLFAALAIFAQFEQAFARIWRSPRATVGQQNAWNSAKGLFTSRLRAFALLCGAAALLVTVFVAGIVSTQLQQRVHHEHALRLWPVVELALQLLINAIAFSTLFRFLPVAKVRWRDAWRGGLFTAVVWELGLLLMTKLVIGDHYSTAYGVIGCFLAVMLWGYYAVSVIFFGAEVVQVLGESTRTPVNGTSPAVTGSATALGRTESVRQPHSPRPRTTYSQPATATNETPALSLPTSVASEPTIRPGSTIQNNRQGGHSDSSWIDRLWRSGWFDFAIVGALIYVSSFLALRQIKAKELIQPGDRTVRLVEFSQVPRRHDLAMSVYAPLIKTLPGPYEYEPRARN